MDMMMDDVADVSGYTFLVNGKNAEQNWTALFTPGERVRLRFINAAAMTYFDVRIPGLEMTVVQADGNNVQPVKVEEFRMAVAETYDVVVQPTEDRAYSIIAESMERAGLARATLAPRAGMAAAVPAQRQRPRLTMADMPQGGMGEGSMDHAAMGHGTTPPAESAPAQPPMSGMDHAAMGHGSMAPASQEAPDPFYAPGSGLTPEAADGGKFLSYADLEAQQPRYEVRAPTREIEIRLTGDMARYVWSINGQVYPEAEPIRLTYGERVRFKFVNETMMVHPMHLHGMWTLLDNGNGERNPAKHVVSIAPATTVFAEVEVDAPGRWAFHCHLLYHMESGMFREVIVEGGPPSRTTG
jgi:L-ascorbate oxidase